TAEENDFFGIVITLSDFNGDGYDDIAAGAPYENLEHSSTLYSAGSVSIVFGSSLGIVSDGNRILDHPNADGDDLFSKSLASGDIDGDEFADLVVGAPGADINGLSDCGNCVVFFGALQGPGIGRSTIHYQGDGIISDSAEAFDVFAHSLTCGDLNGDGFDDLAIGVPWESIESPEVIDTVGAVHTVYGSITGLSATGEQFWTQNTTGVNGVAELEDQFGISLTISRKSNPASPCTETGVTITMPDHSFAPGDPCSCTATVCNADTQSLDGYPLFVILDVAGTFFFAPSFSAYDNYLATYNSFLPGQTQVEVLPEFRWPEGAGSYNGCMFYAAITNPGMTTLAGKMGMWFFNWIE
ncbi:FG-GAP repeat protein, partial [bacterium]|nr:FG-GAP repeat protein [candidate division CSSED10-310 bacterium]